MTVARRGEVRREEKLERETREWERLLLAHPPPLSTPAKQATFYLSLTATSLKTPLKAVPKVAVVERSSARKCEKMIFDSFSTRSLLRCFFFVMKTQANFLTSVKLETILASKLFKNCWAVGPTCDKSTSLQSLFMAISRSCHVHVRLWYSSVGITRLKLCTSMMFRSFSPCQDRKTIFSFNYCKMNQNTGDEECACCGFFLARF